VQNYFTNRGTLNDIERSFREFKRAEMRTKFLGQYSQFIEAFRREKFQTLEDLVSPTLFKVGIE
jgi:hypothetical protein